MVVNMPSEEEWEAVRAVEEKLKKEQPNWFEKVASVSYGISDLRNDVRS
jgi:hypothetical protein